VCVQVSGASSTPGGVSVVDMLSLLDSPCYLLAVSFTAM